MTVERYEAIAPDKTVSSTVGRLIRGEKWQFVTVLSEKEAERLTEGQSLSLRAASGVDFDLDATVLRIGKAEAGKCLVVVQGNSHLAYVTLLRSQSVELILQRFEGIRIPKKALRVGEDGTTGVYCRVGLIAYFKPVEVLSQGEDYCVVAPCEIDSNIESNVLLYTLRPGDEVIVSAKNLYDGKVVG